MHKNPELTSQARILARELARRGINLSHAQAMELVARTQGARTLHVLQAAKAKAPAVVDLIAVANEQAARLAFATMGRYEGNLDGLLESIEAAYALEESQGSRAVEAAVQAIFGQPNSPRVSELFEHIRLDCLPSHVRRMRQELLQSLQDATGAKVEAAQEGRPLYVGPMTDWRLHEGPDVASEVPAEHRTVYEVKVSGSGHQLYVDIAPLGASPQQLEGVPQMGLFIEVNNGKPCVHITNDVYGDPRLSVFAAAHGLYLRPDGCDQHFAPVDSATGDLRELVQLCTQGMSTADTATHRVLPGPNF